MFHSRDGLFFARGSTGDVRIIKTSDGKDPREDTEGTNILFMLVLPENEWASVVCSVSKAGDTAERWKRARLFHGTEFSELQPSGADETPLPFTAEDKEWLNAPMGPIEEWTPTPTQIATHRASDHCGGVITAESDEQVIARVAELEADKARLASGFAPVGQRHTSDRINYVWTVPAAEIPEGTVLYVPGTAINAARLPPIAITKGNTSGTDVPPSCKTEGSSDAARGKGAT